MKIEFPADETKFPTPTHEVKSGMVNLPIMTTIYKFPAVLIIETNQEITNFMADHFDDEWETIAQPHLHTDRHKPSFFISITLKLAPKEFNFLIRLDDSDMINILLQTKCVAVVHEHDKIVGIYAIPPEVIDEIRKDFLPLMTLFRSLIR